MNSLRRVLQLRSRYLGYRFDTTITQPLSFLLGPLRTAIYATDWVVNLLRARAMGAFETALNPKEIGVLDLLWASIYRHDHFEKFIATILRNHFRNCGFNTDSPGFATEFHRLRKKPSSRPYYEQAALYDFSLAELPRLVEHSADLSDPQKRELSKHIIELRQMRTKAAERDVNWWSLLSEHSERIASEIGGEYFGYRRSTTSGEIIRFFMRLDKASEVDEPRTLTFVNEYFRRQTRWIVRGSGNYIGQTLYMGGHAKSRNDKRSLGLRFFALRLFGSTRVLVGPVISMAPIDQPIAARVVMIPFDLHKGFSISNDREVRQRDIRRLISTSPSYAELRRQVESAFGDSLGEHYLAHLIRNSTHSVLKGFPDDDDAMTTLEEEVRSICHLNDWEFPRFIDQLYAEALRSKLEPRNQG